MYDNYYAEYVIMYATLPFYKTFQPLTVVLFSVASVQARHNQPARTEAVFEFSGTAHAWIVYRPSQSSAALTNDVTEWF